MGRSCWLLAGLLTACTYSATQQEKDGATPDLAIASASCSDGLQNGDETGVDCGGSCSPCGATGGCADKVKDGSETDVDCGGECAPCAAGRGCIQFTDCATQSCVAGKCTASTTAPKFLSTLTYSWSSPSQAGWLGAGDVDGDGDLDVVVVGFMGGHTFLNTGIGKMMGPIQNFIVFDGDARQGARIADVNGDGKADVVTAKSGSNKVDVYLSVGDGTFQNAGSALTGFSSRLVDTADFNKDGKVDVVSTSNVNPGMSKVYVALGRGDGTFGPAATYATGTGAFGVLAYDLNGDGNADILVSNTDGMRLLAGSGQGDFQPAVLIGSGAGSYGRPADFNNDGWTDILISSGGWSSALNDGHKFTAPLKIAGINANTLVAVDLNLDGAIDVVADNGSNSGFDIALGGGDGTFKTLVNVPGTATSDVVAGDFNRDGKFDVVALYRNSISTQMNLYVFINATQ